MRDAGQNVRLASTVYTSYERYFYIGKILQGTRYPVEISLYNYPDFSRSHQPDLLDIVG